MYVYGKDKKVELSLKKLGKCMRKDCNYKFICKKTLMYKKCTLV